MMRHLGIEMTTTVKKDFLLERLRTHLAEHKVVVAEAKEGYMKRAKELLEMNLEKINKGEYVSINVSLSKPVDNSSAYVTVIEMLENNIQEDITLSASEFRMLAQDEWDWKENFLIGNACYSSKASSLMGR